MKTNLFKYVKEQVENFAPVDFRPGFIMAKNGYHLKFTHIIIPWCQFKELAKEIDFEYSSSLDLFKDFFITNKEMDKYILFKDLDQTDTRYSLVKENVFAFKCPVSFGWYYREESVVSHKRLLIKLLFNEYQDQREDMVARNYRVHYALEGKKFFFLNLSNEVVKLQLKDGANCYVQYDPSINTTEAIESVVRMMKKVASPDLPMIVYIGVCPITEGKLEDLVNERKILAKKLETRFKNLAVVWDYRNIVIPE